MTDILLIFFVVASIIVIGFIGELFFQRTGVPVFVFESPCEFLPGPSDLRDNPD